MIVLSILGSPRGRESNTLKLVEGVLSALPDFDTPRVFLDELNIKYCRGCLKCLSEGNCPQQDDFQNIQRMMLHADAILLSSPTYLLTVSAQMKTFLDRASFMAHRPVLMGKYGLSVSVSGGGMGEEATVEYLNRVLRMWGVNVIGSITGTAIDPDDFKRIPDLAERSFQLGKDLGDALKGRRFYPHSVEFTRLGKLYMKDIILKNKDRLMADYNYWKEKGWL